MQKLAHLLQLNNQRDIYLSLVSLWPDPGSVVETGEESSTLLVRPEEWLDAEDPLNTFMWLDLNTYLPDDLLTKVDRAAMAVSLETRLPLLDHELIELVWQLPTHLKVREGRTKWILREILSRRVPKELFERPKQGFSVPLGTWLREPLRDWAEDLLQPAKLRQQGYFNVQTVQQAWTDHLSGRQDRSAQLWTILMFQAWVEKETLASVASGSAR